MTTRAASDSDSRPSGDGRSHVRRSALGRVLAGLVAAVLPVAAGAAEPARAIVVGHRGASGYLPEHTLEAKAYAYALGVDFLEQDLVLSKDDVPVVLHDIYVDTVTDVATRFPDRKRADGRYYALDFTLAELKQLRVTERFNPNTGARVFPRRFPAHQSAFQLSTFEEELQLVRGLNQSTGRVVGIYPELKQPKWHRLQGRDLSRVVLPILVRYGYATKGDPCVLQCFEFDEVRRLRRELGWQGRLVALIEGKPRGDDGSDHDFHCTPDGVKAIAQVADGIGPAIGRIMTWTTTGGAELTSLMRLAREEKLLVHAYTIRRDDLPRNCPSLEALHAALFGAAKVDGVFSDFPDETLAWLKRNSGGAGTR